MCRCHCRLLDFAQKGRARAFATAAAAHPSILLIPPRCRPASRATSSPQWSRGHAQASQPAKHRACSALALALALLVGVYLAIGPAPAVVGPHGPCGFARESPKGGRQAGRQGGRKLGDRSTPAGRWSSAVAACVSSYAAAGFQQHHQQRASGSRHLARLPSLCFALPFAVAIPWPSRRTTLSLTRTNRPLRRALQVAKKGRRGRGPVL